MVPFTDCLYITIIKKHFVYILSIEKKGEGSRVYWITIWHIFLPWHKFCFKDKLFKIVLSRPPIFGLHDLIVGVGQVEIHIGCCVYSMRILAAFSEKVSIVSSEVNTLQLATLSATDPLTEFSFWLLQVHLYWSWTYYYFWHCTWWLSFLVRIISFYKSTPAQWNLFHQGYFHLHVCFWG